MLLIHIEIFLEQINDAIIVARKQTYQVAEKQHKTHVDDTWCVHMLKRKSLDRQKIAQSKAKVEGKKKQKLSNKLMTKRTKCQKHTVTQVIGLTIELQ